MLLKSVYLAAVASWLPPASPVRDAIATGRYDADEAALNAYESITVTDSMAPPDMAVVAARSAFERAENVEPDDVSASLHGSLWFQGVDFWPAASYVHQRVVGVGGRAAPAFEVAQMSNAGLAALELAASWLAADPARAAALVTTADRFAEPAFDRWSSDVAGIVYGDGASAAVLARHGFARLRSIASTSDSRLEGLYRGTEPFATASGGRVDVRARRSAFRAAHAGDDVTGWINAGLAEAVARGLDESGVTVADITAWIFPAIGQHTMQVGYLDPLGISLERTGWPTARRTGHVGGGDQVIGLEALVVQERVRPGDLVALVGIGAGFTWTLATVEILTVPNWGAQA